MDANVYVFLSYLLNDLLQMGQSEFVDRVPSADDQDRIVAIRIEKREKRLFSGLETTQKIWNI